jgi:hypothetical protein
LRLIISVASVAQMERRRLSDAPLAMTRKEGLPMKSPIQPLPDPAAPHEPAQPNRAFDPDLGGDGSEDPGSSVEVVIPGQKPRDEPVDRQKG